MIPELEARIRALNPEEWLRLRVSLTNPLSRALILFKYDLISDLELSAIADACQDQLSRLPMPDDLPETMAVQIKAHDAQHAELLRRAKAST